MKTEARGAFREIEGDLFNYLPGAVNELTVPRRTVTLSE